MQPTPATTGTVALEDALLARIGSDATRDAAVDRRFAPVGPNGRADWRLADPLRLSWPVEVEARAVASRCPWGRESCLFWFRVNGDAAAHDGCRASVEAVAAAWDHYRNTYDAAFAVKG